MKVGISLNLTDLISRGGVKAETISLRGLPRRLGGGGGETATGGGKRGGRPLLGGRAGV